MKKGIAIFLLSVYLFSTAEAREFLKFPVIFEHYQEHKQKDNDLTILDFFDIHYMHGSPFDEDYDRDMQLPFKAPVYSTVAAISFVPAVPIYFPTPKVCYLEMKQCLPFRLSGYKYSYHSSIWQPPRVC